MSDHDDDYGMSYFLMPVVYDMEDVGIELRLP
jgi:hypothetical protein